jgi:hypothetical protein
MFIIKLEIRERLENSRGERKADVSIKDNKAL